MIAELRGTVVDIGLAHITLDVRGVGYRIAVCSVQDFVLNTEAHLHTHLAVRETALDLYGFLEKEELAIFELLLKLPKIGPKSAMQILSQADIDLLKKAVASNDPSYLSKMSGIGKKSAEKIVVGLKDVFEDAEFENSLSEDTHADSDAIDALVTLGYSQRDAREALRRLSEDIVETNERIKAALKHLGS
jgi:Holliday junction DNA helicase RuvA